MTARALEWRELARADLFAIVDYISDDNSEDAQRLKDEIQDKVSKLSDRLEDAKIDPYRVSIPRIDGIGPTTDRFLQCCSKGKGRRYVGVSYDSSQFGMIDVFSGEFIILGQNCL